MNNLQWLYDTDDTFRDAVRANAADWLGSTSANFAGTWLEERHRSDYEDLIGQHLDDGPCVVPDMFCSDAEKLRISRFVAQETGKTAESDAAKSEIRGFADNREELVDRITDMVNAKWEELHGDSREKLEADVNAWCATFPTWNHADDFREHVFGWLDRQAAITERECRDYEDELRNQHHKRVNKLRAEINEFNAQLAETHSMWASEIERVKELQSELDKRDAYRELCGRMRKLANEMMVMEVD